MYFSFCMLESEFFLTNRAGKIVLDLIRVKSKPLKYSAGASDIVFNRQEY